MLVTAYANKRFLQSNEDLSTAEDRDGNARKRRGGDGDGKNGTANVTGRRGDNSTNNSDGVERGGRGGKGGRDRDNGTDLGNVTDDEGERNRTGGKGRGKGADGRNGTDGKDRGNGTMGAAAVMELDEVMELKKTVEEIALMEGNDLTLPATMMVLLKAEAQEMTSLAEEDLLGEEALTQEEETLILQLEADLGGQREMTLVVEEVQEVPKAQEEDQEEGVEKLALEKMV
eukprot:CAMPEP_0170556948 /NCGR_PEP_ID=MMETSP0211-20121228/19081_1 /TAXON_ID=311385 /ORGANISM="Pseudokeronopsis sp., Strain OXSARD2" /LENGTH=229 /DNA_ID=CAMNT_0010867585 /DNA_START=39 /DNA_END=729 /DNA_ORIENTATION=+